MKLTKTARETVAHLAAKKCFEKHEYDAKHIINEAAIAYKLSKGHRLATEIPDEWKSYISTHSNVRIYAHLGDFHDSLNRITEIILYKSFAGSYDSLDYGSYDKICELDGVQQLRDITQAKYEFYNDCMKILNSCYTDQQLAELSPELFVYLPKSEENKSQLIDQRTINSVKNMLKSHNILESVKD